MTGKKVIFIVCDAIRWDYLNDVDSRFLLTLAKKGIYVRKLKPSFGFCERTEMFCGAKPEDSGYFTALTFDREHSDFSRLSEADFYFLKIVRKIKSYTEKVSLLSGKVINVLLREAYLRRIRKVSQPIYEIPTEILREISLTEDYIEMNKKRALSVESIFDILQEENKSFLYDTFASLRTSLILSDDQRISKLFSMVPKKNYELILLYLGEGDNVGHKYGPNSLERRKMIQRLDARIKKIVDFFRKHFKAFDILIVGDHGMLAVKKYINMYMLIQNFAKKTGLTPFKDFNFFLDSTMVRLWFQNVKLKEAFQDYFYGTTLISNSGKILTKKDLYRLHLPRDSYYGEMIWVADPHIVIYPDFFHSKEKVKGMHGYEPSINGQKGFAVLYSEGEFYSKYYEERDLIDICPTLCYLLGIRTPCENKGRRFC